MAVRALPVRTVRLAIAVMIAALVVLIAAQPARWEPATNDLSGLLQELAERHVHGERDGEPSVQQMDEIAAERPVETTCGFVSPWAVAHLRAAGYKARVVDTLTLDEWNDTDNGHTMLEVWQDGWRLVDIDQGVMFGGLSLAEVTERVAGEADYPIIPIEGSPDVDAMRAWHQRVFQVPMIREAGRTYFPSGAWDARVTSYSQSYEPIEDWTDRFYASRATTP